ncbi:MAG: tyrosine-type recombinase/integrase [Calditrichaeota bacterium]|jgi:site-specific recombinase XerD|nr:tyrosine-type recombinase/integrase [Calditrichota bacterium]
MILGKGNAQTEIEIIREYHQFLEGQSYSLKVLEILRGAPEVMLRRIGKPIITWDDDEILGLFPERKKQATFSYCAFLAFLVFRGYRRATLSLLTQLPTQLSRMHRAALLPSRLRLQEACQDLKFKSQRTGSELIRLIQLLSITGKSLENLKRTDFDAFQDEYQAWFCQSGRRKSNRPDATVYRLECYLVHWEVIPPSKKIFKHEEYFARLIHKPIRDAIVTYIQWYDAKSRPSSVNSRRAALTSFFLWLQEKHPSYERLDDVNRKVALAYAHHLKETVEALRYSATYCNDQYRGIRLFFEFVVDERLETSPNRNPFGKNDMPQGPKPLPRYISDKELRQVLAYCQNGASLKEKTIVTVLLHTGIRAAELSALRTTNIVQIQGVWKLHIQEGKGLKDRIIPLTSACLEALQEWQDVGWEGVNEHLFTWHGRPWRNGNNVCVIIHEMGIKLGLTRLTPHRFRHTFAVALLNHGLRESALQKLMGHTTLAMTLQYARILDHTVEKAFNQAVEKMQEGQRDWVPNFFKQPDYGVFEEGDAVNWIRLPHGYCRRHSRLHCESDVKCLLCDRFCAHSKDLDRLQEMHQKYLDLNMPVQAEVVFSHIQRLKNQSENITMSIPLEQIPAVFA